MGSVSAECHRALLYHLPVEGHVLALRYLVCVHVIARTSIVIYRRIMNACTVDRFFRLLALSTNALHCMIIPYCTWRTSRGCRSVEISCRARVGGEHTWSCGGAREPAEE